MSNVVGYARVSRHDQNPAAQEAELRAAGAVRVFVDQGVAFAVMWRGSVDARWRSGWGPAIRRRSVPTRWVSRR